MTNKQRDILEWLIAKPSHLDGYAPLGAGAWAAIRRLSARGLVDFIGFGRREDGPDDREIEIFDITAAGRAAIGASPTSATSAAPGAVTPAKGTP